MFEFVIRGIPFCSIVFTVTPHEGYGVTNYRLIYCLFNIPWLTTKKHPNSLIRNVIICDKPFLTLWDYPCRCVSLPFEKRRFAALSLQWRDTGIIGPEITVRWTVCSTACHDWEHKKRYPNTLVVDEVICNTYIAFWIIVITHERHEVSNPQPLDCLLNGISWLTAKEISTLSHWRHNHL